MTRKKIVNQSIMIKMVLFIPLILGMINLVYSQNPLHKKGRLKTIIYELNRYTQYYDYTAAVGYVQNKKFVVGTNLTFLGYNLPDTIVSGKYYCNNDGTAYIDGFWKDNWIDNNRGHGSYVIIKGTFKVSNNKNGIGITANKKEGDKLTVQIKDLSYYKKISYGSINIGELSDNYTVTLKKLSNNKYFLRIKFKDLTLLETTIPFKIVLGNNSFDFYNYIINSKQVKLIFHNGDVFIGKVKSSASLPAYHDDYIPDYAPDSGEYKYKTGEVSKGKFDYNNYYNRFYIKEGETIFSDGSISKGDWFNKNDVSDSILAYCSPTEIRNMAKSIYEKKEKKLQEEKLAKEKAKQEKLRKQRVYRNKMIAKYGKYWGNLIAKGKFTLGMTEEMVSEFAPPKFFRISKAMYGNVLVETWVFDKQKMEIEILDEKGEEGAKAIMGLSLMESMGFNIESEAPTLKFTNGKLTGIYYY